MIEWVVGHNLARSHRPGYSWGQAIFVPIADVDAWIAEVRIFGINSIICLLSDDQLPLYNQIPDGLIAYYRTKGFTVAHVPARDHQVPPLSQDHLERIGVAYKTLPKPVLVHCSAGADRTGMAVDYIQQKLRPDT